MSTPSSEEGSVLLSSHHARTRTSGLDSTSTSSLLFSLPSDLETDVTPPSPASSSFSAKVHTVSRTRSTSRDILDTSHQLGQLVLQDNADVIEAPEKISRPGWIQHRRSPCVAGDEAGYEADGDADIDGDGVGAYAKDEDRHVRAGAGAITEAATTHLKRRPTFLRIDTRQQRRVASMLATTTRRSSPSPGYPFGDTDTEVDVGMDEHAHREARTRRASYTTPHRGRDNARASSATFRPLHAKFAPLTSIRFKATSARTNPVKTSQVESYELRHRPEGPSSTRRVREPVGLGIGFPENHPLRSRAFTLPITPAGAQDYVDPSSGEGEVFGEVGHGLRSEWLPYPRGAVTLCAPNPVRLQVPVTLRPTYPEAPPPIERLPADGARARKVHYGLSASQSESMGLTVRRVRVGSRRG